MNNTKPLNTIPVGGIFKIGEVEFIKFSEDNGRATIVCKDILFNLQFGANNDFSKSYILKKLTAEILPIIESAVGSENVIEFETDLMSLDGSSKHGIVKSKISLPTFDFYRKNRAIFEKHKIDEWWWLATPDSTSEYNNDRWIVCVAPSGIIFSGIYCGSRDGVRPFCILNSNIFVSCDK